jgi:hypothetical protein
MKDTIEKLKSAMKNLEKSKGPILVCAIFLREDSLDKWDIIIASKWLDPHEMESYKIVSNELAAHLTPSELLSFSRIVILPPEAPVVSFLIKLERVENGGYKELLSEPLTEKFGFKIKRAYLLRAREMK